ncbi:MAG: carbohydrate ABC transporter permease [Oscillospiraceae bacterium]|nr:carbohydrate ABC transporter permease [Oscillospiraceae bacterium]
MANYENRPAGDYNANYTRNLKIKSTVLMVICILISIVCLLPIWLLIVNATKSTTDITSSAASFISRFIPGTNTFVNIKSLTSKTEGIAEFTRAYNIFYGFRNSLVIAVCSAALSVFFSGMTAYGLTVYDFKLKNGATTFILMIMMVPMQVVSTGFLQFMVQIKLYDNYLPIILPAIAAPQVVFFMLQYMRSVFPLDIVEASRIDGCGEFRTFVQIGLPILKPAFAVQAIFAFVTSWNNYYTPSMLLLSNKLEQRTMPMMVAAVLGNDKIADFGAKYMAVAISIIPVVIVYLCLSKYIIGGVTLGAVKG